MLKADLHLHSVISDGSDTIEEIIWQAEENGVGAIAITDHDTLEHRALIPNDASITVLAGIEVSGIDPKTGRKAHILGYQIGDPGMVEELTHPILKRRHENSLRQIEILQKKGYRLDPETMHKAAGKYIFKQHIMEQLVLTGQVPEMFGDFYYSTFKNGGICDFDIQYVDAGDAVQVITQAGGKAVLAHPGQQQNFELVEDLVPLGLKGLELNHPANSEEDKKKIRELAGKYGLFLTGGTDYHGRNEKVRRRVGDFLSEESGCRALGLF